MRADDLLMELKGEFLLLLKSGSIELVTEQHYFSYLCLYFLYLHLSFLSKDVKRDNFYSFYEVVAFCRAEAVFARGLAAASPYLPPVFVQITGKMGPLYHCMACEISTLAFYILSPIVGNFLLPFTVVWQ